MERSLGIEMAETNTQNSIISVDTKPSVLRSLDSYRVPVVFDKSDQQCDEKPGQGIEWLASYTIASLPTIIFHVFLASYNSSGI